MCPFSRELNPGPCNLMHQSHKSSFFLYVCMYVSRMYVWGLHVVCVYIWTSCACDFYVSVAWVVCVYMWVCSVHSWGVYGMCGVYERWIYVIFFCVFLRWVCVWGVYICACDMRGMCVHVCCVYTCMNWVCGLTVVCGVWEVGDGERQGKSRLSK